MIKLLTVLALFFSIPSILVAQQKPQYSQYMINNYLLNPAISGIEDYADLKLGIRSQWAGIKGAPQTFYLSGHLPLGQSVKPGTFSQDTEKPTSFNKTKQQHGTYRPAKPHHGLGGLLLHDRIGPFARTEASFSYAYHLPLTKDIQLASGAAVGLLTQTLRSGEYTFGNPADNTAAGWTLVRPQASVGVWLYSPDFYVGAAGGQLFANAFTIGARDADPVHLPQHYFLTGAYKFKVGQSVALIPSVLVKSGAPWPLSIDYNLRAVFADRLWAGASFRQNDSFIGLAGLTINHFWEISYAYDAGVNAVGGASAGIHELVLGLRLFNRRQVLCPQNLW
jgi:type IX secretion system PorP/SprF family membrane protein